MKLDTTLTTERGPFLARLGLPETTTNDELRVILQANVGESLPFKPGVLLALVDHVAAEMHCSPDDAANFVLEKFPMLKAPAAKIPDHRVELLADLDLPFDTDEAELNVILQANEGQTLPFKKSVYLAMLRHTMRQKGLPQNEAVEYVANKFPMLNPPDGHAKSQASADDSLRAELIQLYGLPSDASAAAIKAAAEAEKNQNVAEKARRAQEEADEVVIAQKMRAGLNREQAIAVIKRNREHGTRTADAKAARQNRILEIIRTYGTDSINLKAARRAACDEFGLHDGSEFLAALEVHKKSIAPAAA